ncbi:dienelactone hydrolase [Kineosphaera limosa]|uniref:Uncharacterized protein n=1 Tax=Kineosphaera limosa NBRC 100340 TaxID=1184609 RepID=K6VK19_9MICO|nr:hypothetical protein [Kineosphaera limosa]NYE01226.1 dienelactone hydrolase [Kineosphaera limosa]GAB96573.1 hypothetical protein KILIM_042_00170 [Kineosphaera limosa NBRC 100340]
MWAAVAVATAALALWGWSAADRIVPSALGASLRTLAPDLGIVAAVGLVLWLVLRFVVGRFVAVPAGFVAVLLASLVLLVTLSPGASRVGWWALVAIVLVGAVGLGTSLWALTQGGRRAVAAVSTIASVALVGGTFAWLLTPTGAPPAPLALGPATVDVTGDPGSPGSLPVKTLAYGSGTDRLRPEYAGGARFTTKPVDLSRVITGWTGDSDRTQHWGFDATQIPLNAQVWYPEGPGPYPLALILHGNKSSVEFSEGGFAYLAERLASQGTVVASIDANFLSTTLLDRSGGIGGADLARALLPLEHLEAWRQIATDGPLKGRVDLTKVALIGHSRGGEAVAVAAMLQPRDAVPGQEDVRLDYDVPIRSVVALAPADGQFTGAGAKVQLKGVDYLAIQGSHDVDVASFGGLDQLARTTLGRDDLGATLYLGGADHSQFNTLWGRRDLGDGAAKYLIDTGRLITPEQQRAATMEAVSAFLATTLRGQDQRNLFADNRTDDRLRTITSLRSGRDVVLLDAQAPDKAVGTKGVTVSGSGLTTWEVVAQPLRWGPGDNRIVRLEGSGGRLDVRPAEPVAIGARGSLRLDVAAVDGSQPAAITVEVTDAAGRRASAGVRDIPPPIVADPLKAAWMRSGASSEPVLQTRVVSTREFTTANPELDLRRIATVSVVLAPTGDRELLLDHLVVSQGA